MGRDVGKVLESCLEGFWGTGRILEARDAFWGAGRISEARDAFWGAGRILAGRQPREGKGRVSTTTEAKNACTTHTPGERHYPKIIKILLSPGPSTNPKAKCDCFSIN